MRRNLPRQTSTSQNLDSFLDILTNTVGVLMFVGLFVSLIAVEAGSIIRTPIVSDTKKTSYSFEVRNQNIIDLEDNWGAVEREVAKRSLQACKEPQLAPGITKDNARYHADEVRRYLAQVDEMENCIKANRSKLKDFQVSTTDYKVSVELETLSFVYQPLQIRAQTAQPGLQPELTQVRDKLSRLNPKNNYIVFIVRSNSFAEFRKARDLAWEMGFDVGWEPFAANQKLILPPSVLRGLTGERKILPQ